MNWAEDLAEGIRFVFWVAVAGVVLVPILTVALIVAVVTR